MTTITDTSATTTWLSWSALWEGLRSRCSEKISRGRIDDQRHSCCFSHVESDHKESLKIEPIKTCPHFRSPQFRCDMFLESIVRRLEVVARFPVNPLVLPITRHDESARQAEVFLWNLQTTSRFCLLEMAQQEVAFYWKAIYNRQQPP